jgi:hypothetical protein
VDLPLSAAAIFFLRIADVSFEGTSPVRPTAFPATRFRT